MNKSYFLWLYFVLFFVLPPVSADICLPETSGNQCTAGDFILTEQMLSGPASCTAGDLIDITLRVGMVPTANERYDIGIFVGDSGNSPIGGASCTFESLAPLEAPLDFKGDSGSGPYRDLDNNACGDTANADGEIFRDIVLTDVLCQDIDGGGKLDVSYALAWKQSKGLCDNPDDASNFIRTSSKCSQSVANIDVVVLPPPLEPSIDVTKTATPNVIHPGDEVVYTISVLNDGPVTITLTSLIDDKFDNLDGKGSCKIPQTIASGDTYSCGFSENPAGGADSTHTNTVTASGNDENSTPVTDNDSAVVEIIDSNEAGIGFLVWLDLNADGSWQKGEPGVDGVTLDLKNSLGTVIGTTTTQDKGQYLFKGLSEGDYQVVVTDTAGRLNGMVLTAGVEPHDVTLIVGQKYMRANFGYAKAEISVSKQANPSVIHAFEDTVTFTVSVANKGPIDVELDQLIDSMFGDLNGQGDCRVTQTIAVGKVYSCSFDRIINGSAGDTHENTVVAVANDLHGHILFDADSEVVHIIDGSNAAIGDLVWLDSNLNGIHDAGEPGIDGVTVQLRRDSDGDGVYDIEVGTEETTLNSGEYNFVNLLAGDYQVVVTDTNNQLQGLILTGGTEPHPVTLATAEIYSLADFGYAKEPLPVIAVYKVAEPTVIHAPGANVTYHVAVKNIGQTDVILNALFDDRFGNLDGKDSCSVPQSIVIGDIYICSFTETISGDPGDIHTNTVGAIAKDSNDHYAFGNASAEVVIIDSDSGAIGNLVWHDIDADGIFDDGEPGIGNVTLDLLQGNSVIATTTTDGGGSYGFINLSAGSYRVRVTDTHGVLAGSILTGGTDPHDVGLAVGQIYNLADFGYAKALIKVLKHGEPSTIHAPSGEVKYTVAVVNAGFVDVFVTELIDDKFGNLDGQGNCRLAQLIRARTSYACSFTKVILGDAGGQHTNVVTARAVDRGGNQLTDDADFTVSIVDSNDGVIGDLVWNDENGNGIRELSEPGLGLVTVELKLDSNKDGSYETAVGTTITQADGYYLFSGLSEGDYQVSVTDESGIVSGMTLTGGTNPHLVELDVGELYLDADFGYYRESTLPPVEPPPPVNPPGGQIQAIPTVSEWALILLSTLMMMLFLVELKRTRKEV